MAKSAANERVITGALAVRGRVYGPGQEEALADAAASAGVDLSHPRFAARLGGDWSPRVPAPVGGAPGAGASAADGPPKGGAAPERKPRRKRGA